MSFADTNIPRLSTDADAIVVAEIEEVRSGRRGRLARLRVGTSLHGNIRAGEQVWVSSGSHWISPEATPIGDRAVFFLRQMERQPPPTVGGEFLSNIPLTGIGGVRTMSQLELPDDAPPVFRVSQGDYGHFPIARHEGADYASLSWKVRLDPTVPTREPRDPTRPREVLLDWVLNEIDRSLDDPELAIPYPASMEVELGVEPPSRSEPLGPADGGGLGDDDFGLGDDDFGDFN